MSDENIRKSGLKTVTKPAAPTAGSKTTARTSREVTEPTLTISINRLALASRPFRNAVWVQASQSKTTASLERLSGNGPLVDNLVSLAGSQEDGQLDPESLLHFCKEVLAAQAEQETGSRQFRLHIPADLLPTILPDGLNLFYTEPGAVSAKAKREPVSGLSFG